MGSGDRVGGGPGVTIQRHGDDEGGLTVHEGLDARGKFAKGNKLGRGRPYRSVTLIRTYGQAIERSCPPETLAKVIEKAVKHALGDGPRCDGARMFLLGVLGPDQIHVFLNNRPGPPAPYSKIDMARLSDDELATLQRLLAKAAPSPEIIEHNSADPPG
ncbi:MAG: hypothetical protein ACR2M4_11430 [Actinomycetota bacterium]